MAKRGLGDKQIHDTKRAKEKILKVLENGSYSRYKEIQEKTGLSTATLTKHLKELEKGIIERWEDKKSEDYPTPVYYRLNPTILLEKGWHDSIYGVLKEMDLTINTKKINSIHSFVEYLNTQIGLQVLANIRNYLEENNNEIAFKQSMELYVLDAYKEAAFVLKGKLEELSVKGINVQALIGEAERSINKHYENFF